MSFKGVDQVGNSGSLLTDSDVDAEQLLLSISRIEIGLLVDNGVNSDGSLSGLSVTNDELSLSSTDGNETIDGLQTSLHRFTDGLSGDDARCLDLDSLSFTGLNGSVTIDRVSQGIEDSTQHFFSDRDIDDGTCSGDSISFLDFSG